MIRNEGISESLNAVSMGVRQVQQYELEMERLLMEREDKLSRDMEEYSHKLKFIQKDMSPPLMPPFLTENNNNPLKNKPV